MASIVKRGEYQWRAQVRRRGYPIQTKTFESFAEASAWAAGIESDQARGVFVDRSEAEGTTLGELIKRYRKEITPHKKSAESEYSRLDKFARSKLAPRFVASIRSTDIAALRDEWVEELDEDGELMRSPATVLRDLNLLGHIFSTIIKDWHIPLTSNPVENIRKPKGNAARDRRLQDDEEKRLLLTCAMHSDEPGTPHSRSPYLRTIVIFAIETAMRKSEILSLKWKDVNLKKRVARLYDTKNKTDRSVPLSSRAVDALKGIPHAIGGKVFPVTSAALKKQYARAVARAEIEDLHFHDLRHEAISRLFENEKLSLMEVASISGHKTMSMLQRYTHLRAEDLAKKLG